MQTAVDILSSLEDSLLTKQCARCSETRSVTEFRRSKTSKDGLFSWCKPCCKVYDQVRSKIRRPRGKPGQPAREIRDGLVACSRCKQWKPLDSYAKNRSDVHGIQGRCRACLSELDAARATPEVRAKKAAAARAWRRANKKRKMAENIQFKLSERLRSRLYCALRRQLNGAKNRGRGGSAVRDLGCDLEFLMSHLEDKFQPGMSWDNYGDWHIDHIKPLVSFDLTDSEQCRSACNFSNLQPLWATDNIKKGSKHGKCT